MRDTDAVWGLLPGIVDRPGRTLAAVASHPRWWWLLPAMLSLLALALSSILTAPLLSAQAQRMMADQLARLSAEQAAVVQRMTALQTPVFLGATAFVTGLLGLAIAWLLQSAILYFGTLIAGADITFPRILATAPWLALPFMLESLLQTLYAVIRGQLLTHQGLSFLVATGQPLQDARNLAYAALSQATLFRLWHLVLVYMLFRAVARLSRPAAFAAAFLYALLLLAGALVMAAIGKAFTPAL